MTILPPAPGEPRRPDGPRDSGDAWVIAPTGERYWGRYGAAGLLAVDPERGVLLQHRVSWSHFGGTWALPGGARHEGESALDGALRESQEEAGVPDGAVVPRLESIFDLGYWSYATVVADVRTPFDPVISDPESVALEWVPVDAVDALPLHPGFAASWPSLRALLEVRPALVIDAANVVGSVPDGWWKDRAGAAERLHGKITSALDDRGFGFVPDAAQPIWGGTDAHVRWYPETVLVVEGRARAIATDRADVSDETSLRIVAASGSGDDAIVGEARALVEHGRDVVVVTSDRELVARVVDAGARALSAGWLLAQLGD